MLQSEGVLVEVSTLDVAVRSQAEQLVADCERLAPIGGIFHLAMILEDRLILKHVWPCYCLCCHTFCLCRTTLMFGSACHHMVPSWGLLPWQEALV